VVDGKAWARTEDGEATDLGPGDIVIIPPGVYHGFTDVADHVEYVSVRPDPDHVLPAGYVHPLLKK
jgi:quercetin dioxygenase-like cupin family protein